MNGSDLRKPAQLLPGIEFRRALTENGTPCLAIIPITGFAGGEIVEIESMNDLRFMYAWLGALITDLQHARARARETNSKPAAALERPKS